MKSSVHDIAKRHLPSLAPEDFFLLLVHATKKTKEYLIAHPEYPISTALSEKILSLIQRRIHHEPIAFITGHKEFYGFDFLVTKETLIPRPETEIMIDLALQRIQTIPRASQRILILDVGTGSGNIILSLAKKLTSSEYTKQFSLFGLDISEEALKIARKNRKNLSPKIYTRFVKSDLIASLPARAINQADHLIILANLPYLSPDIYRDCPPDVKNFEPKSALMSPQKGLSHIIRLLREAKKLHRQHPRIPIDIFLEISPEQKIPLAKEIRLLSHNATASFHYDLAKKHRFSKISLQPDDTH